MFSGFGLRGLGQGWELDRPLMFCVPSLVVGVVVVAVAVAVALVIDLALAAAAAAAAAAAVGVVAVPLQFRAPVVYRYCGCVHHARHTSLVVAPAVLRHTPKPKF